MKEIKPAILFLLIFTLLLGGIYPAVITGIASIIFPSQAAGSFITDQNGKVTGTALIGQPFSDPKYFWPRPSAAGEFSYNPMASGGSNTGPTNPDLVKQATERVKALRESGISGPIPAEMVLASASGLDPHIRPESAMLQIPRIARSRKVAEQQLAGLVLKMTEPRQFGFLGEPRINVLELNLALDSLQPIGSGLNQTDASR